MIKNNLKLKKTKLTFRKLKLSDYKKFEKLFYLSFKKKLVLSFSSGDIFLINCHFVMELLNPQI